MAKKQKKATPKRAPTKRQLSKWQRQTRIRRIVIIAAVVFLAGILSWVGYEYYEDYKSDPLREVVIEVNSVPFTMKYYVRMLDAYTQGINYTMLLQYGDYFADMVADDIINAELRRQGAKDLGIEVTTEEIEARLEEYALPNDRVYRDIVSSALWQEKLGEYFGSNLPDTMEQAHVQVMLVESQEVATELISKIEAGGNFTALAEEFSCNSTVEGDLGWLPRELMSNTLIADAAFNLTPGEIRPIYEETATKNIGYWLIEVTDKQDEEIKARAMLLGSEAEAEQVKAELVSRNFSSLAKEYSQHESKDEGGELGWLEEGDMGSEAFDEVVFNITDNEVSEPVKDESVQTTGGYWLVKGVDRGERGLGEEVREELIANHLNDWFKELKEDSTIENLLDADKKSWAVNKVLEGR
ncbi:MAG: peptidylprolyl isomerase [Chloroflexota bacterium]|nr:peptidylprolyl isomerase [Chloroflexota bacterium]